MAKAITFYKFHAQDHTLVIEPIFNINTVLAEDVEKDRLIKEVLWAGLNNQMPEAGLVFEHIEEMKQTAGYGRLLDDLTVGYRLTDGSSVYEVRTHPGQFLNEYEKDNFSLDSLWNLLLEDAVAKTKIFPVEATMSESEYQKAVAYPFHLSPEQLQACPLRITKKTAYRPLHLELGDRTHRVEVFTHTYSCALLDEDYRTIASVPVTVECKVLTDDGDPIFKITHERNNVCYEGGYPVSESDAISGILNMKVAKMLHNDERDLLYNIETQALQYENQLPRRELPFVNRKVTYETDCGEKTVTMALIPKDLELESVREFLVAEALRSLEKAIGSDFDDLDKGALDPRQESPVNSVLRDLSVSVTDGENVFEASIPLFRSGARPDCAALCRYVSDELIVKDPCKVQNICGINQKTSQEKMENLDVKAFQLKC